MIRFILSTTIALSIAAPALAQEAPPPPSASPLSLSAATSRALQQVSALRQAELEEQSAVEDLRQARTALLPRARDEFSISYNSPAHHAGSDPSFIAANAVHEYQNLLGVTGDIGLGMVSAVRRSRALLEAARAGTELARRALVRGVGEAYYGAAVATAKRRAAEESLAAATEFERMTRQNVDAGEVPEVDALRARLQTAARRDELATAREDEAVANAQLATLLGSGIDIAPPIEPLPQAIADSDLRPLANDALARHPQVAQAEAQLRAAQADVGVARGDLLPHITYSVDEGFDATSLAADELRQHRGVLAGATIDVPLFDWGAARSRQRQAELRARGAAMQRELALRDVRLQFATARQEAATAAERVTNARDALGDAERNVTISVARYRAGEAPISEATDAQTTAAQQRLALQQALADYYIARMRLTEAAGE